MHMANNVATLVTQHLSQLLGLPISEISPDCALSDLGIDTVTLQRLMAALSTQLNISLGYQDIKAGRTVRSIITLLETKTQASTASPQSVEHQLMVLAARVTGWTVSDMTGDTALSDLGFDSIKLTVFGNLIREQFDIVLEPVAFLNHGTLAALSEHVSSKLVVAHPSRSDTTAVIGNAAATGDTLIERLIELTAGITGWASTDITPDSELSDLGFDSIKLTAFGSAITQAFGVVLAPVVFLEQTSLEALAAHVAVLMSAGEPRDEGIVQLPPARPEEVANLATPAPGRSAGQRLAPGSVVVVVGAGPGGLVTAKCLREDGMRPVILERTDRLGGTYVFRDDHKGGAYKSLKMQSSKHTFFFSDFPPPASTDLFPPVEQVNAYLHAYADHFGIRECLRFSHAVNDIARSGDGWVLNVKTPKGTIDLQADGVVLCTGSYWVPNVPEIAGAQEFSGQVLTADCYHDNSIFVGKKVLVIGGGVSGCDVASEASETAQSVHLASHNRLWILPSMLGFVPNELTASFVDRVLNDQLDESAFKARLAGVIPDYMRKLEASGLMPTGIPNNAIGRSDEIIARIDNGQVKVSAEIARFDQGGVWCEDGTYQPVDIVVYCTGYRESPTPFAPALSSTDFYQYTFLPEAPSLARMSVPYAVGKQKTVLASVLPFLELVARWYCGVITGRNSLPEAPDMQAWVTERSRSGQHPVVFDGWLESLRIALEIGAFPRPEEDWARYWELIGLPPLSALFRLVGPHAWPGAENALAAVKRQLFRGKRPAEHESLRLGVLKGLGGATLQKMVTQGQITESDLQAAALYQGQALTPALQRIGARDAQTSAPPPRSQPTVSVRADSQATAADGVDSQTIAIIGMAARIPGCKDLGEFRDLLERQGSVITQVPAQRWRWQDFDGNPQTEPGKTDAHYGSFITDVEAFCPAEYGLTDAQAMFLDPQARLLLDTCRELVESAGYGSDGLKGRDVGVMVGVQRQEFMAQLLNAPERFTPAVENGSFHGLMINRIAHHFDWRGGSYAVNAACASSLVAIHNAVEALRRKEIEVAVAGGVNFLMSPLSAIAERQQLSMSPGNTVRAFDQQADGTIIGEGCGLLLLKPLKAALADGDCVLGLIAGSAVGNNGRTLHELAPSPEGQAAVLKRALTRAGVEAASVDYVEGQGAATSLSDQAELHAYHRVFSAAHGSPGLTNAKANIGHLETASGVLGIIKTLMSMNTAHVPGIANLAQLNWPVQQPLAVRPVLQNETWVQHDPSRKVAVVHNFGAGGVNADVVLTSYESARNVEDQGPRLCVFSAHDEQLLRSHLKRLITCLQGSELALFGFEDVTVIDIAASLSRQRQRRTRFAVYAADKGQLLSYLEQRLSGDHGLAGQIEAAGVPIPSAVFAAAQSWMQHGRLELPAGGRVVPLPASPLAKKRLWPFDLPVPASHVATPAPERVELIHAVYGSTLQKVKGIASTLLTVDVDELDEHETFGYLGFSSVLLKQFATRLSAAFDIAVGPTVLFSTATLGKLTGWLEEQGVVPVQLPIRDPQTREASSQSAETQDDAIAIIGLAARLPGADNVETFGQNQLQGRNCIVQIPADRWQWQDYEGDPRRQKGKTNARWGGFISGVDQFAPEFFGILPFEAELMDPQHRLFLKTAWEAVWNAGMEPTALAGQSVGVFVGMQFQDYQQLLLNQGRLDAQTCTGNAQTMLPNRLSYLLDINGPSQVIDTACSSSLVAVHAAVQALRNQDCEMAIVGGSNLMLTPDIHIMGSQLGVLSPTGQCRTLDAGADGYVRGEGVGVVVLKSLASARRDGDPVVGVIRGSAVNHGGKSASLTAPNQQAQSALMVRALDDAGLSSDAISYVEMHGTGTELGDPIEVEAITAAFRARGTQRLAACALGSAKSNIGHLEAAAGMAGLINVLMAMRSGQLPGMSSFKSLNPYIQLGQTFEVQASTRAWADDGQGRVALVNSFGFGGTNASVVVSEPPRGYVPTHQPIAATPWNDRRFWIPGAPMVETEAASSPVTQEKHAVLETVAAGQPESLLALRPAWNPTPLQALQRKTLENRSVILVGRSSRDLATVHAALHARGAHSVTRLSLVDDEADPLARQYGTQCAMDDQLSLADPHSWATRLRAICLTSGNPDVLVVLADEQADASPLGPQTERWFHLCKMIVEGALPRSTALIFMAPPNSVATPAISALASLLQTVVQEGNNPQFMMLDVGCSLREPAGVKRLLEEIEHSAGAGWVAYLPDRVQRGLAVADLSASAEGSPPGWFKHKGVYLIPGGAGELGIQLASAIVSTFDATIAMVGRSPETGEIARRIQTLRALASTPTKVIYCQADITRLAQVEATVADVLRQFGRIDGVINLVTDHRDAFLYNKSWSDFQEVAAAKAVGTELLDRATAGLDLDLFAVFSSQAALGMAGGADYAYGCAYQNAFAARRHELQQQGRRRGRSLAVSWSRWEWDKYVTPEFDQWVVSLGYQFLNVSDGLAAWKLALASGEAELFLLKGDRQRILGGFDLELGSMTASRATKQPQAPTPPAVATIEPVVQVDTLLSGLSDDAIRALAKKWLDTPQPVAGTVESRDSQDSRDIGAELIEQLRRFLKVDQVDAHTDFRRLGIDSVIALQVVRELESLFEIDIPSVWLFKYPTVSALAAQIEEQRREVAR
ncbi:SDR family NAD(P)-dependent oxidoreductase [Pseudomonas coronafaciens pv. coronafaciens]|uniref:SDR family NAD(P)-dependent oxidoreductase n=2 Tax=Pseudomonas coronafaciens TaxID=53409 RepID=A0AAE6QFH0_9PSED|nr:SDR family NAD(P)-dependent oxidoreductase [Pseudomonas coronafaciens pv. coronafaciens]